MPRGRNEPALAQGQKEASNRSAVFPLGWGSCNQQPQALEQHPAPTAVFTAGFFHLGCGRQDPTQTRRPPFGLFFTSSTVLHTYLEGAIAEEHEQGLVSLHPLQEEQGWLPQVIYAGQVTSL